MTKQSKTPISSPKIVYFPMTCDVITPGHIMCIRYLQKHYDRIIIGLLTDRALLGYKKNAMIYLDRRYILQNIDPKGGSIVVAGQDNLNPFRNIARYRPHAIASGDGFEQTELDAAKKFDLKIVNIKLPGERKKRYASSLIKKKICKQNYSLREELGSWGRK